MYTPDDPHDPLSDPYYIRRDAAWNPIVSKDGENKYSFLRRLAKEGYHVYDMTDNEMDLHGQIFRGSGLGTLKQTYDTYIGVMKDTEFGFSDDIKKKIENRLRRRLDFQTGNFSDNIHDLLMNNESFMKVWDRLDDKAERTKLFVQFLIDSGKYTEHLKPIYYRLVDVTEQKILTDDDLQSSIYTWSEKNKALDKRLRYPKAYRKFRKQYHQDQEKQKQALEAAHGKYLAKHGF